jgi:multiple sugar transport system substrate-binding protein
MKIMNVNRKMLAFVSTVLLLVLSISGVAAQDVVTINWWNIAGNEMPEDASRAIAEAFEAEHPNIKVNLTILPESAYDDRMTTTIGAGEGAPDVALFWSANWWPQALDLTPYLEADPDLSADDYFENFWINWASWQDKVVGLPLGVGANFVMYNKDVFDEAGVDYPTADWTPDEFIEIASAIADPELRRWGGDRPRGPFRAIWNNYGAFPYSDDSMMVDGYLNSAESIAAYTWLWDLVNSGATPTPADIEILGTEGTGPIDLFLAGRLAMATLNQAHMLVAVEEGVNFGIVPEPNFAENEQFANAWSLTASVWAGTEHPEEAYEFLSFFAGPEGQAILMAQGNLFPSIPAVLEEYENAGEEYAQGFFSVLEATQVAEWTGAHPCWRASVIRAAQDAWDLIMLGEIGRDEVEATLNSMIEPSQVALEECVARLGG